MSKIDVSSWSCDERNRQECRDPHGCHCREITALKHDIERLTETNSQLLASFDRSKDYVERAIVSFVGDPPDNQFQKGFLSALETILDEAFSVPSTERS